MGTDIHGVFQRHDKADGKWHDVASEYEQDRHYQLFAVLADVRNGFGFAGIKTGEPVVPISEPRGLPDDFIVDDEQAHPITSLDHMAPWRRKYYTEDEPPTVWMGDHSFSWLTGAEILEWAKNAPTIEHTGVLDRDTYEEWDKLSEPQNYCGEVWGNGVVTTYEGEEDTTPGWTHISCTWQSSLRDELSYFFDEVARLVAEHGEIRFVFGFDS